MKFIGILLITFAFFYAYIKNPPIPEFIPNNSYIDWSKPNVLHIMYSSNTFDCNIYASMSSILKHTDAPVWFHIGVTTFEHTEIPALSSNSKVSYYKIDNQLRLLVGPSLRKKFKRVPLTFGRFFLPELLPTSARSAFYLDTDTIVTANLFEFVNQYNPYPFIMAEEVGNTMGNLFSVLNIQRRFFKYKNMYMRNNGVLLVNTTAWKANQMTDQLIDLTNTLTPQIGGKDDQLSMNLMSLDNNYGMLNPSLNMGCGGFVKTMDLHNSVGIIHACGSKKWTNYWNPSPNQKQILQVTKGIESHKICNMRKLR